MMAEWSRTKPSSMNRGDQLHWASGELSARLGGDKFKHESTSLLPGLSSRCAGCKTAVFSGNQMEMTFYSIVQGARVTELSGNTK